MATESLNKQADTGNGVHSDSIELNVLLHEAFVTFEACGPLGPWVISNSTWSPSCKLLYPSDVIAL
jgi:hypothetical protein